MNIPTTHIYSAQNRPSLKIEKTVPFCCAKRFPVVGKNAISACISSLLLKQNPSNVFLCIVARVVDAIQRMPRGRLWANIPEKVDEAVASDPFGTDFYSKGSIKFISHIIRIVAPRPHVEPCSIFGGMSVSVCMAMLLWGTLPFPEITSARYGPSISEFVTVNEGGVSAIAFAFPSPLSSALARYANRDQAAKPLPGNILGSIHNAVVSSLRRFEMKPEEAQQREGSFRGIPLSGSHSLAGSASKFNT